jgi:hypothetical protein
MMRLSFKDWLLVIIRNKSIETSQTPRRGTAMRLPHSAELQPQTQLIIVAKVTCHNCICLL